MLRRPSLSSKEVVIALQQINCDQNSKEEEPIVYAPQFSEIIEMSESEISLDSSLINQNFNTMDFMSPIASKNM